jgi:hypothetical protein
VGASGSTAMDSEIEQVTIGRLDRFHVLINKERHIQNR